MDCRDCPRYEPERRCLDGKVNPRSWTQAVETANVLGVRAICALNAHRERLVRSRHSGLRASREG
jgi:hypothetical protein